MSKLRTAISVSNSIFFHLLRFGHLTPSQIDHMLISDSEFYGRQYGVMEQLEEQSLRSSAKGYSIACYMKCSHILSVIV